MTKLFDFSKMFVRNQSILRARKLNVFFIIIILFMSVIMASIPLYMGRISLNTQDLKDNLPGIEMAFKELYDLEPNITINEQGELIVNDDIPVSQVGDYTLKFENQSNENQNAIIFLKEGIIIQHKSNPTHPFSISGNYSFLKGFDFSKIKSEQTDYDQITDNLLHSIHYGNMAIDYVQITFFNLIQIIFYSGVVSLLLYIGLGKQNFTLISYFKMVIVASFFPAFVVALVSFINIQVASLLFPILFTTKIILIYFKVFKRYTSDEVFIS